MDNNSSICVTVLVENTARSVGLLSEHGLSYWIETKDHRILFDTGQGMSLIHNAHQLGIDLSQTDSIVLSHGHYDHSGGLERTLEIAPNATVFAHPAAFQAKFGKSNSHSRYIGIPKNLISNQLQQNSRIQETQRATPIHDGIWVTGAVPRRNDFEDVGGDFYLDEFCQQPDTLLDDQSLFFETNEGIVILFGCAHAGAVNIIEYVSELTGKKKIHAVIGGMHLLNASPERMERTMEAFKKFDVNIIGPVHCTGMKAFVEFAKQFPNQWIAPCTGSRFVFS